jgi:hypothetical protein
LDVLVLVDGDVFIFLQIVNCLLFRLVAGELLFLLQKKREKKERKKKKRETWF